ncbi:MAG TPA: hypothetical protein PLX20_15250 [Rhodocyclaceae bacterium]|nr:hypothetical protein [Rhodocyclaceae bacterium]HMZ84963.1 hypothetical protein [Rhodocyclaceae bacterium]HNA04931.1 hypothetical protein [Rhodocyclaceae bacterium]HNB79919.1 hypothetical protein [Rhodocyclaceae bacterium]HNC62311.1 hypothetical protein [Rhodocyclaceae bacterium]
MFDILIVFGLLGGIAVLVLHVLPRRSGGSDAASPQTLLGE